MSENDEPTHNSGISVETTTRNLKPWPKGVSGNPGGRPAVRTLSKACREVLSQPAPDNSGLTFAEAIARKLADKALEGDVRAAEELADRAEGKPGQSIDLTVTRLAEKFYSMSREDLLKYAETGKLPEGMSDELQETT